MSMRSKCKQTAAVLLFFTLLLPVLSACNGSTGDDRLRAAWKKEDIELTVSDAFMQGHSRFILQLEDIAAERVLRYSVTGLAPEPTAPMQYAGESGYPAQGTKASTEQENSTGDSYAPAQSDVEQHFSEDKTEMPIAPDDGTEEQSTSVDITEEQSTQVDGTEEQSTQVDGTEEQSTQVDGTDEQSTQVDDNGEHYTSEEDIERKNVERKAAEEMLYSGEFQTFIPEIPASPDVETQPSNLNTNQATTESFSQGVAYDKQQWQALPGLAVQKDNDAWTILISGVEREDWTISLIPCDGRAGTSVSCTLRKPMNLVLAVILAVILAGVVTAVVLVVFLLRRRREDAEHIPERELFVYFQSDYGQETGEGVAFSPSQITEQAHKMLPENEVSITSPDNSQVKVKIQDKEYTMDDYNRSILFTLSDNRTRRLIWREKE